jgi:hypothetical protein
LDEIKIEFKKINYLDTYYKRNMTITIPNSSLRAKYLRKLPYNSVFKDPVNSLLYRVEEGIQNNCLSKVAVPYHGDDQEPIELEEVEEKHLKLANPKRHNVNLLLKNRISELEEKVEQLNSKLSNRSKYEQIKQHLNGDIFYEGPKYMYSIQDGIIVPFKIELDLDETKRKLEDLVCRMWKTPSLLHQIMNQQKRLQSKLLDLLSKDSLEKVITFSTG